MFSLYFEFDREFTLLFSFDYKALIYHFVIILRQSLQISNAISSLPMRDFRVPGETPLG